MRQIKEEIKPFVSSNKEVRNGLPVFKGTRVPVYIVLEHLALGWAINDLKEAFPSVKTYYIAQLIKAYSKQFKT